MRKRLARPLRWLATLVIALFALSIAQVVAVRFVDPLFTLTMIERVQERWSETGELGWVDYRPLPASELGEAVARAAVSSEDARFFLHDGFDWDAICRAVDAYDPDAKRLRGGSTISQQVAKNVFLWQERSWLRKGLEVYYTVLLELLVPKERILELYLDVAETGDLTFGFEAGAQRHFKKPAKELTKEQAAQLASILPSPRRWTPTREPAASHARGILRHPAPFPGDPTFTATVERWAEDAPGPLDCIW